VLKADPQHNRLTEHYRQQPTFNCARRSRQLPVRWRAKSPERTTCHGASRTPTTS